jgi:hypothetical protein
LEPNEAYTSAYKLIIKESQTFVPLLQSEFHASILGAHQFNFNFFFFLLLDRTAVTIYITHKFHLVMPSIYLCKKFTSAALINALVNTSWMPNLALMASAANMFQEVLPIWDVLWTWIWIMIADGNRAA